MFYICRYCVFTWDSRDTNNVGQFTLCSKECVGGMCTWSLPITYKLCSKHAWLRDKRMYGALPTMQCFWWDILYRKSCGPIVMKHTLINKTHSNLVFQACFITITPHDHLYKISHWKQCIVGSASYPLLLRIVINTRTTL